MHFISIFSFSISSSYFKNLANSFDAIMLKDFLPIQQLQSKAKTIMSPIINKITFIMNGISSLLGWNAVLSSFDYYDNKFPGKDVYTWFPIPLFLMYVVIGICWKQIHKRIKYKHLIMIGLVVTNICMVLLPLMAYFMKQTTAGFAICLLICGIIGMSSNLTQLSFFAILNFMTLDIVNVYNQGLAVSGLTMVLIRILILGIKGADDSNNFSSILIYMIATILVNSIDIVLNIKFFISQIYVNQIQPQTFHTLEEEKEEVDKLETKPEGYFKKLLNTHKEIFPFDILILLNYIQTFMLFPSITFAKKFLMDPVWGIAMLNLVFNVGDLVGRFFCSFRNFFNRQSLYYLFVVRFLFYWTMISIVKNSQDSLIQSDTFAFINLFFFALTNGIATNGNFMLTFETVKINKSYAGVLCGLLLQIGIFSGTLLAIPLKKIIVR